MFEAGFADCFQKDEAGVLKKSLSAPSNYAVFLRLPSWYPSLRSLNKLEQICKNKVNEEVRTTVSSSWFFFFLSSFVMSSHSSPNFLHNSILVSNTDLMCSDNFHRTFSQLCADGNVSRAPWQRETSAFAAAHRARSFHWLSHMHRSWVSIRKNKNRGRREKGRGRWEERDWEEGREGKKEEKRKEEKKGRGGERKEGKGREGRGREERKKGKRKNRTVSGHGFRALSWLVTDVSLDWNNSAIKLEHQLV